NCSSYDKTYGALAGVIAFLLLLWLTNLALLFGGELDAELERGRELQSGVAAEETVQLPPRDTRNIEKAREKEEEDVRRGRELRVGLHGEKDDQDGRPPHGAAADRAPLTDARGPGDDRRGGGGSP